jgi:hypothetical protein
MATPVPAPVTGSTDTSNIAPSMIRTWVPVIVGSLISWVANLGIHVSAQYQGILIVTMTAAIIGLYYTAVRYLETKFPVLSMLLGSAQTPVYIAPAPAVVSAPPAPPAV